MTVGKHNYIHSRNGRIGGPDVDHGPADLDALFDEIRRSGKKRLVAHFHGGLVSKSSALGIAATLMPVYSAAYPVFFVWESGAWETIRNNLADIAREPIFRELIRKLLEYTLGEVQTDAGARGAGGTVDPKEVKAQVDAFFADPANAPVPFADAVAVEGIGTRSATPTLGEEEIEIDLEEDRDFLKALQAIGDVPEGARRVASTGPVASEPTKMDPAVLDEIAPRYGGTRGLISLSAVAFRLAKALARVLKRYAKGRDHGLHATVTEEVLRAFYGELIGKSLFWNQMKKDTIDAFAGDPDVHVGTAFLARLKAALENGLVLDRIFLVGHSTGGIYISHLLEAADAMGLDSEVQFDVVMLAPANSHKLFDKTVAKHGARIRWLRMFGMQDSVERNDGLLGDDWRRAFYPSSLLYFVSGLLEDEDDMPLLGMQRFNVGASFTAPGYPECDAIRKWLGTPDHRLVWSIADNGDGRRSKSTKHANFDNDPDTLAALAYITGAA